MITELPELRAIPEKIGLTSLLGIWGPILVTAYMTNELFVYIFGAGITIYGWSQKYIWLLIKRHSKFRRVIIFEQLGMFLLCWFINPPIVIAVMLIPAIGIAFYSIESYNEVRMLNNKESDE